MSLFLKIFLWFWLAIALVVAVIFIVNWSTQSEPLVRQWQTFIGEAVNSNSLTAAQIYHNEGKKGLDEYLSRVVSNDRVNAVGFYDSNRQQIAGTQVSPAAESLFDRAAQSETVEFMRVPDETFAAKKVNLRDGG